MPTEVRRTPGQLLKTERVVRVGAVRDLVAIEDAIAVVVGVARAGLVDVVLIAIRRAVVVRIEIRRIGAELELDRVLEPVSVRVQRIGWRSRGLRLDDRRLLRDGGSCGGIGGRGRYGRFGRLRRRPW